MIVRLDEFQLRRQDTGNAPGYRLFLFIQFTNITRWTIAIVQCTDCCACSQRSDSLLKFSAAWSALSASIAAIKLNQPGFWGSPLHVHDPNVSRFPTM